MSERLFTVDEAADQLGISRALMRKMLETHKLTVVRLGRKLLIPEHSLHEVVRLSTVPFTPHPQKHGAGRPRKVQ